MRSGATPHAEGDLELGPADDVGPAPLGRERTDDRAGAVGLDGVGDEVRRAVECRPQRARFGGHRVEIVDVGGRPVPADDLE